MMPELIEKTRSIRRFKESEKVEEETLKGLVNLARLSASGANQQPLKYVLSAEPKRNATIFRHLAWAAALKDWPGPAEGERPAAYIIILGDTKIMKNFGVDPGIAAQSMVLGARENGLGACMLGSIKRQELQKELNIPAHLEILLVVAFGVPNEKVVLEDASKTGSVTYFRDAAGVHHVPKRPLNEIIVEI